MKKILLLLAIVLVSCSSNEDTVVIPTVKEPEQVFTNFVINYTYFIQDGVKMYQNGFVKFTVNPYTIESSEIQLIGLSKEIGTNKFTYRKEWQGVSDSGIIFVYDDRIKIIRNNIEKVYYKN